LHHQAPGASREFAQCGDSESASAAPVAMNLPLLPAVIFAWPADRRARNSGIGQLTYCFCEYKVYVY
jgi:hypothetical protein